MKNLILCAVLGFCSIAGFADASHADAMFDQTYHCSFVVETARHTEILEGNLLLSDLPADTSGKLTHLTLEPNGLSDGDHSARIVAGHFANGPYFRMSIHKKGDTGKILAFKDIELGEDTQLSASEGDVSYSLKCSPHDLSLCY